MKSALLKLHLAVFFWGFTGVLGRVITLNEGLLVWWRLLITVATVWLLNLYSKGNRKIAKKDFFKIGGIGAVLALHWLCFYGSIKYANVSVALTCMSTTGLVYRTVGTHIFSQAHQWFRNSAGLNGFGWYFAHLCVKPQFFYRHLYWVGSCYIGGTGFYFKQKCGGRLRTANHDAATSLRGLFCFLVS